MGWGDTKGAFGGVRLDPLVLENRETAHFIPLTEPDIVEVDDPKEKGKKRNRAAVKVTLCNRKGVLLGEHRTLWMGPQALFGFDDDNQKTGEGYADVVQSGKKTLECAVVVAMTRHGKRKSKSTRYVFKTAGKPSGATQKTCRQIAATFHRKSDE